MRPYLKTTTKTHTKSGIVGMPVILALRRKNLEDQKFKTTLGYTVGLMSAWALGRQSLWDLS